MFSMNDCSIGSPEGVAKPGTPTPGTEGGVTGPGVAIGIGIGIGVAIGIGVDIGIGAIGVIGAIGDIGIMPIAACEDMGEGYGVGTGNF